MLKSSLSSIVSSSLDFFARDRFRSTPKHQPILPSCRHAPSSSVGGGSSSNSSSSGGLLSGLFGSSSSKSTCRGIPDSDFDADPAPDRGLQKLLTVTAAPLTAIIAIVCFGLAVSHLANFTIPHKQCQLVRVTIVPAVFAIFFDFWPLLLSGLQLCRCHCRLLRNLRSRRLLLLPHLSCFSR